MHGNRRVLLAGESWVVHGSTAKGVVTYHTGMYEEGAEPLLAILKGVFEVDHLPNHLLPTQFPEDLSTLAPYGAIILSDAPSDSFLLHPGVFLRSEFRPNRLELLRQWVNNGGGLAMIGGYMSFSGIGGLARYAGTALEQALPVGISQVDDRVETPEGVRPTVVQANHPILRGLPRTWPRFLGYNRFRQRDGDLLLECGDDPFLVVGSYGRGRALCFASDCSPHWGSREFLEWPGYAPFWVQAVDWLGGAEGGT